MQWEDDGYTRKDENGNLQSLEEYEAANANRSMFTRGDIKLYLICGVGFMLDAYDLFIINLVNPIWTYEYWGGLPGPHHLKKTAYPLLLKGAVNAAANIGNIIGQVSFGFMGDTFGRKFVYGKELIICMVGIILVISLPNALPGGSVHKAWYLFGFRVLMGIGIGGDYPMSASIVAERSTLKNRGRMLALIFSNQGWGTLAASITTLCILGAFSSTLKAGNYNKLDGVWRTQIGVALVPAAVTLYFRLKMPESRKFTESQELSAVKASSMLDSSSTLNTVVEKGVNVHAHSETDSDGVGRSASVIEAYAAPPTQAVNNRAAMEYFKEWRHLKTLIGTSLTWFLVDVSFYGINLNQTVLLSAIGFATGKTEWDVLLKGTYGNLIIAAAGYVPGYFFTVFFIEILGRRWIQIQGFLITALMFAIIAGDYNGLGTGGKFACFTIAQFFFNFGPNATTFIVPGEIFPSRVRGFAHGISAAVGKLGAILSGVLFNYLSQYKIGIANTLWIFFACNLMGAVATWFLVPESKGVDADAVDYAEVQEALALKAARHRMVQRV